MGWFHGAATVATGGAWSAVWHTHADTRKATGYRCSVCGSKIKNLGPAARSQNTGVERPLPAGSRSEASPPPAPSRLDAMLGGAVVHRRKRAGPVLAFAVALLGWAPLAAPPPAEAKPLIGFNENSFQYANPTPERKIARLGRLAGADVQRFVMRWPALQPLPGVWNWQSWDAAIAEMHDRGIRPLITLDGSPAWARTRGECGYTGNCPPAESQHRSFAEVARQVALRFAYADPIIEIWNEPNWKGQWQSQTGPDPARYARLFITASRAVRTATPDVPVLVGSLPLWHLPDESNGRKTISSFLDGFYAELRRHDFKLRRKDGLGLHAFIGPDETRRLDGRFGSTLAEMRSARDRFDPGRRIWITEAGLTTTGVEDVAVSPKEQASALLELMGQTDDRDIGAVVIHSLIESNAHENTDEKGFGLVTTGPLYAPKPAFCALLKEAGNRFRGCAKPIPDPSRCELVVGGRGRDIICGAGPWR